MSYFFFHLGGEHSLNYQSVIYFKFSIRPGVGVGAGVGADRKPAVGVGVGTAPPRLRTPA